MPLGIFQRGVQESISGVGQHCETVGELGSDMAEGLTGTCHVVIWSATRRSVALYHNVY